eukprot:scaffold10384_cov54-Phaeocystis_antarctica.AAC.4
MAYRRHCRGSRARGHERLDGRQCVGQVAARRHHLPDPHTERAERRLARLPRAKQVAHEGGRVDPAERVARRPDTLPPRRPARPARPARLA